MTISSNLSYLITGVGRFDWSGANTLFNKLSRVLIIRSSIFIFKPPIQNPSQS